MLLEVRSVNEETAPQPRRLCKGIRVREDSGLEQWRWLAPIHRDSSGRPAAP